MFGGTDLTKLRDKLYTKHPSCLHTESYIIRDKLTGILYCGPCFFREGVESELPTRLTIRETSGLFGAPQYDPRLMTHLMISVGLVPPDPEQSLREFRTQRSRRSKPNPKLFPFTSSLWELMGVQPPLGRVLVKFCEGYNELAIARDLNLSLYNVQERLRKSVNTGYKFLRI